MTLTETIHGRRVRVLDRAATTGNVAETCRTVGLSRSRYYEWKRIAEALCAHSANAVFMGARTRSTKSKLFIRALADRRNEG